MTDLNPFSSASEDILFPPKITLRSRGKLILLDSPKVMAILNITPDSFFAKSRVDNQKDAVLTRVEQLLSQGADILDIGGYSTRPAAEEVSEEEELTRVLPVVEMVRENFGEVTISIDTFRSKLAKLAVEAGADIVNDVTSGDGDREMIGTIAKLSVPYIVMHSRGTPQTMQQQTQYEDILLEINSFFAEKLSECKKAGIKDVIIDPGFGFAKTLEQNYWILKNLSYFKNNQVPILAGLSRKSMIYKALRTIPEDALNGTTALHMAALMNGANLLRVHDVKEARETISLYKQLRT